MSLLLWRELLRLAPYGAIGLVLVLAAPLLLRVHPLLGLLALQAGTFLAPGVLGIATLAPDTASGATAFFTRLPIAPWRWVAVKLVAAGGWTLLIHLADRLALAWLASPGLLERASITPGFVASFAPFVAPAQACGLGLGCLASAVVPRTMPAILLAPSLAVSGLLVLLGVPMVAWRIPPDEGLSAIAAPALGLAGLIAAALAFLRGEPHRPSARPALLAAAVMAPALVLGVSATAVAHAWTVEAAVPDLAVGPALGVAAPSGDRIAVELQGRRWTGPELRVAVLGHGKLPLTTVLPFRDAVSPEFSPDGSRLLLRSAFDPGGWLVDLAGRWERLPGLAPTGFGFPWVAWLRNEPLLVREQGGDLETFLPDPTLPVTRRVDRAPELLRRLARAPLDGRSLVGTLLDGRVVLADREGLVAVEPPVAAADVETGPQRARLAAGERLFGWPASEAAPAAISPRGRAAVRRVPDDPGALEVLGPPGTAPRRLASGAAQALILSRERLSWSPEERFLALALPGGDLLIVELASAAVLARLDLPTRFQASAAGPAVWSGGADDWVASPTGDLLHLGNHERGALPVPAAAGLGRDRFVPLGRPLRQDDVAKGGVR